MWRALKSETTRRNIGSKFMSLLKPFRAFRCVLHVPQNLIEYSIKLSSKCVYLVILPKSCSNTQSVVQRKKSGLKMDRLHKRISHLQENQCIQYSYRRPSIVKFTRYKQWYWVPLTSDLVGLSFDPKSIYCLHILLETCTSLRINILSLCPRTKVVILPTARFPTP